MALQTGGTGPYAPAGAIIEVIERYRDRGLQTPITTDVLERVGIPESLSQRTLQALRLLDFVDADGQPSAELERLSRVPDDGEFKQGIRELLTAAYAEVYSYVDPATDGIDKVRGAFRAYNPRSQQDRMVSLFLGLCEWAGVDTTAAAASKKKTRAEKAPAPKTNGPQRPATPQPRKPREVKAARGGASSGPAASPLGDTAGLPPGLVGLLQQIPRGGAGWPEARRDEFLIAFKAVLDFSVPVRDQEPTSASIVEEEGADP